jgi:hypothetical protein
MGQSILSHRVTLLNGHILLHTWPVWRKGIALIFANLVMVLAFLVMAVCGNANELGDTGGGPGKSSLFFLRVMLPGIGLSGDRDVVPEKRHGSCDVRCAFVCP